MQILQINLGHAATPVIFRSAFFKVMLQDLHKIEQSRKDTVAGYIRGDKSLEDKEIPDAIILICVLFYGSDKDKFDPKWKIKTMTLSNDDRRVEYQPGEFGNIFCQKIVDSGYHEWKFKIIEGGRGKGYFVIGIWRCSQRENPPIDKFFTKGKDQGYGFAPLGPKISTYNSGVTADEFGVIVEDGSTITMILDFDQLSLCWKINDKSYGKSHDIIKDTYRAAVYMANSHKIVEIVE